LFRARSRASQAQSSFATEWRSSSILIDGDKLVDLHWCAAEAKLLKKVSYEVDELFFGEFEYK
jgi:hypothetical protein